MVLVHYTILMGASKNTWKDGKIHGSGKKYWSNGDILEGQWINGKISGVGREYGANGERRQCTWKNDVRDGPGIHICLMEIGKSIYGRMV